MSKPEGFIVNGVGGWYVLSVSIEKRVSPFLESRQAAKTWIKKNKYKEVF